MFASGLNVGVAAMQYSQEREGMAHLGAFLAAFCFLSALASALMMRERN